MVVALEAYPGVAAAAADRLCAVWQQEEESCWHSEPEDADEDCSPLLRQLWAADQLLVRGAGLLVRWADCAAT